MDKQKKKLLFVTGTRAEYGLAKATILGLKKSRKIDFRLLVTGMHTLKKYGLTLSEIKKEMPVHCVVTIKESDDMLSALTKEINGIKNYAQKEKIDAMMVVGDRDEAFAGAAVGIHLNIPVIHVSGGDISGPTVDHYLRNAITIFSKLHLVQTKQAAKNVISLGADPKNVHVVGSMGLHNLNSNQLYSREETAKKLKIDPQKTWHLVTHHPTPFEKDPFPKQIDGLLTALTQLDPESEKIIVYPNSDEGSSVFISRLEKFRHKPGYYLFKNLGRDWFLSALWHSQALIGNSSAGLFEAGYLKVPFINVGQRQSGRERGANVLEVGYQPAEILKGIQKSLTFDFQKKVKETDSVYQGEKVVQQIVRLVQKFLKSN